MAKSHLGRPSHGRGDGKRVIVALSLSAPEAARLDAARGLVPRAVFIRSRLGDLFNPAKQKLVIEKL